MSKLEKFFAEFLREIWAQSTMRVFALWEVALVVILAGKRLPWWVIVPGFFVWMFLRGAISVRVRKGQSHDLSS